MRAQRPRNDVVCCYDYDAINCEVPTTDAGAAVHVDTDDACAAAAAICTASRLAVTACTATLDASSAAARAATADFSGEADKGAASPLRTLRRRLLALCGTLTLSPSLRALAPTPLKENAFARICPSALEPRALSDARRRATTSRARALDLAISTR